VSLPVARAAPAVLGAFLTLTAPAAAQEPGPGTPAGDVRGDECCLTLLLPVGARNVALGRATTAFGSPAAIFVNPAGLADVRRNTFDVHHSTGLLEATALTLGLARPGLGTFGLTYQLFDHGEMQHRDEQGFLLGTILIRDQVVTASFATPVAAGVSAGANLKLFQFRVDCTGPCGDEAVVATTYGVDAGIRWQPRGIESVQLGAAVQNLGFALQVRNARQADPMPTRLRLGAAHEVLRYATQDTSMALWLSLELTDNWHEPGAPLLGVGAELAVGGTFFMRGGWAGGEGIESGVAVGLGMFVQRYEISVGKSFHAVALDADRDPVHISFGIRF
jgi:hypothetical protein